MVKRVVVLCVIVGGVLGWWWWSHRQAPPPAARITVEPASSGKTPTAVVALAGLTVTVVDDRGAVTGATVRLASTDGEVRIVHAGDDGIARVDGLAAGGWDISGAAPGHLPAALPRVQLAPGAAVRLTIALAAGGRALTGTISDVTGGPIAGARVDATPLGTRRGPVASAVTGDDGTYALSVSEGPNVVAVSSPDYAPQTRDVDVGPGGAVAHFALVPGGAIEGVVLDERSREPVAGAQVEARREGGTSWLAGGTTRRARTGSDGRFRLTGLRPGVYELTARAAARASRAPTVVGLGIAEQVADVELAIAAGAVVRGVVVDDAGAPVGGLEVSVTGSDVRATTDGGGAFVLAGLARGSHQLAASGAGFVSDGVAAIALTDPRLGQLLRDGQRDGQI